jgi:hypothetical protein
VWIDLKWRWYKSTWISNFSQYSFDLIFNKGIRKVEPAFWKLYFPELFSCLIKNVSSSTKLTVTGFQTNVVANERWRSGALRPPDVVSSQQNEVHIKHFSSQSRLLFRMLSCVWISNATFTHITMCTVVVVIDRINSAVKILFSLAWSLNRIPKFTHSKQNMGGTSKR